MYAYILISTHHISNHVFLISIIELVEMCKVLKEANLFAHRCELSRRILVENVIEGFKKKNAIRLYFESHNRSGGGPIETIEEIHGGNGYIVTFKSHKGIKKEVWCSLYFATIITPFGKTV